jgi:quercetin dioxygenase-like cupin family protein
MKFVIAGVGADGRSRVVEIRDVIAALKTGPEAGSAVARLWMTLRQPPENSPPRRPRDDQWLDTGLAPGAAQWAVFTLDPRTYKGRFHHTSTVDFDIVLSGEVTLALEQDEVVLKAGDCVLIPGVVHNWVAGPRECVVSVVMCSLDAAT